MLGSRDGRPVEVDLINAAYGQDWSHSFPNGDPAFIPKNPMCADDLKKFAQPQTTTWGFQFADTPDDASIEAMKAAIEANPAADMPDSSDLGEEFFTGQVCDYGDDRAPAQLCLHRFYLNCDKAEGRVDREACTSWNVRVGELQGGAYYWWDQNRGFTERLSDSASNTFGAYADGFSSIWSVTGKPVVETVKFMADPGSVIDDWANALKSSAVDLTEKVIRGLTTTGSFDTTNDTFLTWYAYSTGIGILAMAITAILAAQRISDGKRHPRDLLMDYGGYMLFGVVAMLFAPGLAAVFLSFIEQVSQGIGDALGAPADQVVTNMSAILGQATSETVAGGAIAGIILFGLMLIGVLAAYFGLLMHAAGLPILLCGRHRLRHVGPPQVAAEGHAPGDDVRRPGADETTAVAAARRHVRHDQHFRRHRPRRRVGHGAVHCARHDRGLLRHGRPGPVGAAQVRADHAVLGGLGRLRQWWLGGGHGRRRHGWLRRGHAAWRRRWPVGGVPVRLGRLGAGPYLRGHGRRRRRRRCLGWFQAGRVGVDAAGGGSRT
ncbi:hypothetical protein [Tomitella cavernea]|uniref:Uncharacterized protein n=1 Tax=Tomitella cavernea TaxID=1387982 RepID=A0ABP9D5M4_9ACTN